MSVNIPIQYCPGCNKQLECTTGAFGDFTPTVGDVSICWHCQQVCIFDDGLQFRKPTPTEEAELSSNADVQLVISGIRRCRGGQ